MSCFLWPHGLQHASPVSPAPSPSLASWLAIVMLLYQTKKEMPFAVPDQTEFLSLTSSLQLLSRIWLFASPWTAACQASLSITNSQSLLKLMSIESVMPSNHLILCHPLQEMTLKMSCLQSFPASGSFPMNQFFASSGQNIGVSASPSVLQMNIQDSFPLGLTGLISFQSKGCSRVFSNTTV